MKCCVSTFVFGSLPNGRAPDLLRVTLLCFHTGAKYHLPGCIHVQRRPKNATLLGPCLDCFEFQLKSRDA